MITDWVVYGVLALLFILACSKASFIVLLEASIVYSLVGYLSSKPELWNILGVDYMLIMALKDVLFLTIFLLFINRYALVKIAYSINIAGNLSSYISYVLVGKALIPESVFDFCYDHFEQMQLTINALFIVGLIINDRNRISRRVSNVYHSLLNCIRFIGSYISAIAQRLLRVKRL